MIYFILLIEENYMIIQCLAILAMLLTAVGIITLIERKILGNLQYRWGPGYNSLFGILQPLKDGLKLFTKESIWPVVSQEDVYVASTCLSFFLSIFCWILIPTNYEYILKDIEISFLFILAVVSLTIYSLMLSGWGSNSNYPLMGAIRSAAQMISYEIAVSILLVLVFLYFGSIHLHEIVNAQSYCIFFFYFIPFFLLFYICGLAEINRLPFDLPEAESELVSGYHTEYSGVAFIFFNIGEYAHVLFLSTLLSEIFFGGWIPTVLIFNFYFIEEIFFLTIKIFFFIFTIFYIRGILPRMRYDQSMELNWNLFIPIVVFLFYVSISLLSIL